MSINPPHREGYKTGTELTKSASACLDAETARVSMEGAKKRSRERKRKEKTGGGQAACGVFPIGQLAKKLNRGKDEEPILNIF